MIEHLAGRGPARGRRTAARSPRGARTAALLCACLATAALPLAAAPARGAAPAGVRDADGDGVEDLLQRWAEGRAGWQQLREAASPPRAERQDGGGTPIAAPAGGPWERGLLRVICVGRRAADLAPAAAEAAAAGGVCRTVHDLARLGGVACLAVDPAGLRALLRHHRGGALVLDRDGSPALDRGRLLTAVPAARSGPWRLRGDWTSSIAILDSGCDTAHDDLGDFSHDNIDGPPPAVGHALDWYPATAGWPVFSGYRVVGWHDVTDDFPLAAGPWDYHYHGTALASAVAGGGLVDPAFAGVAADGRLTVVKFYDFDGVWHQWAGDFLAACAWVLDNRVAYRVRAVLATVNWDADLGIGAAVAELADAGILTVAAMGNFGEAGEPGYPARLPEALTVGAVDDEGAVAAFSGRGPPGSGKPDLVAPGGGLLPERGRITAADNEPNDTYTGRAGTSLAAAHVAGAVSLILEAWRSEGIPPPTDLAGTRLLAALLRATAAPVDRFESADGSGSIALPVAGPDELRGWGLLQTAAAAEALLQPLSVGEAVTDSLGALNGRRVLARRLLLPPGAEGVVAARPGQGLDVRLRIVSLRGLVEPGWGSADATSDAAGPGGTETVGFANRPAGPAVVLVDRLSGAGLVTVSVTAPDGPPGRFLRSLSGALTGLNFGRLAAGDPEALLVTQLSDADPNARIVDALGPDGRSLPGWPQFLFVSSLYQGGLSRPLAWDLDADGGDEIVVGSDFGRLYFFRDDGQVVVREPAARDVALTAPVGLSGADGPRILVGGADGGWHLYGPGGDLVLSDRRRAAAVLPPAAGDLTADPGEEAVLGFADGEVTVVDAEGNTLPGWPLSLAAGLRLAPVLADLDGDGALEIVVVEETAPSTWLRFHVLRPDGGAGPGDGTTVAAPDGGRWIAVAPPQVVDAGDGGFRAVVAALAERSGVGAGWRLQAVSLGDAGATAVAPVPGLLVPLLTPSGVLALRGLVWGGALAWDRESAPGTEPAWLVAVAWEEQISGLQDLAGGAVGWLGAQDWDLAQAARSPLAVGGAVAAPVTRAAAALYEPAPGCWVVASGRQKRLLGEIATGPGRNARAWRAGRGDGRNSGGLPVVAIPSGVATGAAAPGLAVGPNPGHGSLSIRWRNLPPGRGSLSVYDLRGRLVRRLEAPLAADGRLRWDGRDDAGRPAPSGSYLLVLRHPGGRLSGRAVLAR